MVQTPKPPPSKPARKSRKPPVEVRSPRPEPSVHAVTVSQQGRPEENLHFAKVTVVAPSCAQNVYWLGKGFGWPLSSKHACLNCCHPFEGPPVGLPVTYDDRTDGFLLSGNFCSFSCCKRHILETRRSDTGHLIDNLALLAIKAHKQDVRMRAAPKHYSGIPLAPPKTALQLFGGGMSIEDFRKGNVRVTEMLAREPFVKMTWADALVAVKGNVSLKTQTGTTERLLQPRSAYAVGRSNPIRRKNTLDAFLKS